MLVVTTVHEGERAGCLVGFHTQCSIDPPRFAVWISKANHTARVAVLADAFALHFLDRTRAPERKLAELFGTVTDDHGDKFRRCAWHAGPDDVPLLDDCGTRVIGRRDAVFDHCGDHICFVLAPVESQMANPLEPL